MGQNLLYTNEPPPIAPELQVQFRCLIAHGIAIEVRSNAAIHEWTERALHRAKEVLDAMADIQEPSPAEEAAHEAGISAERDRVHALLKPLERYAWHGAGITPIVEAVLKRLQESG